jgi:hypothetical protein
MGATQLQQLNHNEHYKFHFKETSWILYECKITKKWGRCTFLDLHKFKNNVSRIQYNTTKYINYIIIDIDNDELELYKNKELPSPNFILKNRFKRGGHLFYVLDRTISHEYYKSLWSDTFKYFTNQLSGDENYTGYIAKNYLNEADFEYIELEHKAYNIYDLYKHVKHNKIYTTLFKEEQKTNKKAKLKVNNNYASLGRNCAIFESGRLFAYSLVKENLEEKSFKMSLYVHLKELNNNYASGLNDSELRKIWRSITKYCLKNKEKIKTSFKKIKKMELGDEMSLKEKQKAAANYASKVKAEKTILEIKKAIAEMKEQNIKINISSVAEYSKIHRNTISKYKELLN